jgi:hypothetical protein
MPSSRSPARATRPLTLLFVVPMPANVTNRTRGSSHWRRGWLEKKALIDRLDLLAAAKLLPPCPDEPLERATVRSVMYLGGAMDEDNAMARHKPILDWLKKRGYIRDDRKRNLTWVGFPEQVVKRGQEYRIELTLEAA